MGLYLISDPSNLELEFDNNYLTATGTEDQSASDPESAIKFTFFNRYTFTIRYGTRQHLSTSTGRAAFIVDGNSFNVFGGCIALNAKCGTATTNPHIMYYRAKN